MSSVSGDDYHLMMCIHVVLANARLNVNVALNRPSYQISTFIQNSTNMAFEAKYANDGNLGTHLYDAPCMCTEREKHPWWSVDLGVALYVAGVRFTNRDRKRTVPFSLYFVKTRGVYNIINLGANAPS